MSTNSSTTAAEPQAGSVVAGILLTLAGAATLALSMTWQRYGLASQDRKVPFFFGRGPRAHRMLVWFFGLVLYGAANGFKIVAADMAPWSVLGSVWTLLLVFNLVIARVLLKERLTWPKIVGAVVILLGAVICVIGTPLTVRDVQWSAPEFTAALGTPSPLTWTILLAGMVLLSVPTILWYERRYARPLMPHDAAADSGLEPKDAAGTAGAGKPAAPPRLDLLMLLVYGGSLGLDEGIADLLLPKGFQPMLAMCNDDAHPELSCGHPMIWVAVVLWVLSAFASVFWWMRKVYSRYEVTVALPIEYGALNAANVCTGLLFFSEHRMMDDWQLALVVIGCVIILCGIGIGMLSPGSALRASSSVTCATSSPRAAPSPSAISQSA